MVDNKLNWVVIFLEMAKDMRKQNQCRLETRLLIPHLSLFSRTSFKNLEQPQRNSLWKLKEILFKVVQRKRCYFAYYCIYV